jgi:hypothetical protein
MNFFFVWQILTSLGKRKKSPFNIAIATANTYALLVKLEGTTYTCGAASTRQDVSEGSKTARRAFEYSVSSKTYNSPIAFAYLIVLSFDQIMISKVIDPFEGRRTRHDARFFFTLILLMDFLLYLFP